MSNQSPLTTVRLATIDLGRADYARGTVLLTHAGDGWEPRIETPDSYESALLGVYQTTNEAIQAVINAYGNPDWNWDLRWIGQETPIDSDLDYLRKMIDEDIASGEAEDIDPRIGERGMSRLDGMIFAHVYDRVTGDDQAAWINANRWVNL